MTANADWRNHAACAGHPTNWWFPDDRTGNTHRTTQAAITICRSCPVQTPCLNQARADGDHHGIRAGINLEHHHRTRTRTNPNCDKPINHGTHGGYQAHLYRKQTPCEPCRQANADEQRRRRTKPT